MPRGSGGLLTLTYSSLQVRRMLAHCGLPVLNLKRLAYGACTLGGRPQHVDTRDCHVRVLHGMHVYVGEHSHGQPQPVTLYHCHRLQPGEARCATPAERRWACELLEATARADRCGLEVQSKVQSLPGSCEMR